MGAVVVLILIALIVAVWAVRRQSKPVRPLELKLAVIGFEASGKTVYIGSMFHELRIPDAGGVFLDTSPENAGRLTGLYNTTADTEKPFPPSTNKGELIEWPFTVKVRTDTGVTEVATFHYLDFAGESLRDMFSGAANPETQRLYDRFKNSDVLMAALDGLQVKRYMEGRPLPRFYQDLEVLLALMSGHHKAVNLILTKWDILQDHYTFRQVVERLFQVSQFARFVQSQGITGTTRLIPVSSVGSRFVREDGNRMRKLPGKVINPERVEMPIACALPAALTAAKEQVASSPARRMLLAWASAVKVGIGPIVLDIPFLPGAEQPYMTTMTTAQRTPVAVTQLTRYCSGRLGRLERDFPESDLVRFMNQQGL
jgi:hypothetical protein